VCSAQSSSQLGRSRYSCSQIAWPWCAAAARRQNSDIEEISDLMRSGGSVAERRSRSVGGARWTEGDALSHIDEHSAIVDADRGRVWRALGEVLGRERLPGRGVVARLLDAQPATRSGDPLVAGSTLPGFIVVRSEPHSELALEGRHRFASYALIFRLGEADGHTTIRAETRATFAGGGGRIYRALVSALARMRSPFARCWAACG
jgi:hypothetical protein